MVFEVSWLVGNLVLLLLNFDSVVIFNEGKVRFKVMVRGKELQFWYVFEGEQEFKKIGLVFDVSIVSDECGGYQVYGSFMGVFVGVVVLDLNGMGRVVSFEGFVYMFVKYGSDWYEVQGYLFRNLL